MLVLGSYAAVDPSAVVAVTVAVQPPVDHALVSFLVSFTYVRTRPAQTI
jgi:hypothetical protein